MKRNKVKTLPKFHSLNGLVKFVETHDMAEYMESMPEVQFHIDIKTRKHVFTLDEKISDKVTKIAKTKKVPSEVLINLWLRERLLKKA